jgi:biotin-dependent carboxylase-like uncharacterized protein
MTLDIVEGGLLTTVQDAGRPDWLHLGVPRSGPADATSFAIANLLAGNEPGAAALELTLVGPTLSVLAPITIALAGADLGARIRGGRRLRPGRGHRLVAGDIVEIPGDPTATPTSPARAYLALAGGIDVPIVLGSRSTCLAGGFGGFEGRPLRTGDRLSAVPGRGGAGNSLPPELVWPARTADPAGMATEPVLRILATSRPGLNEVVERSWRVAAAADRVGIRLELDDAGGDLPIGAGGETLTHGVIQGAIQVPSDGRPILLGPDHQTTGGYAVVGVVISADLPILGQLRPGAPVRLAATDAASARAALDDRRAAMLAGRAALRDGAGWDALIDEAGG